MKRFIQISVRAIFSLMILTLVGQKADAPGESVVRRPALQQLLLISGPVVNTVTVNSN
jgi:hypothetical protein